MINIKHIFFDLDHTLWDFEKNSALAFQQVFNEQNITIDISNFLKTYQPINFAYWKMYREDKLSKSRLRYGRLKDTFDELGYVVSEELVNTVSLDYIDYLPNYNNLLNGAIELLDYLQDKYELHIITNGFEEVQTLKLENSGIKKYFNQIITSESVGVKKPNSKVFDIALLSASTDASKSIMIGDNYEADILGALNVGMLAIHCNFNSMFYFSIKII